MKCIHCLAEDNAVIHYGSQRRLARLWLKELIIDAEVVSAKN
jgi:hypothetical protein